MVFLAEQESDSESSATSGTGTEQEVQAEDPEQVKEKQPDTTTVITLIQNDRGSSGRILKNLDPNFAYLHA